jgi:hypothetical protein
MRTTFDLPDPLFRAVKTRAVQQGVKLKDLVASYLEAGLRGQAVTPGEMAPRHRPALPIARKADGSITPARTNQELATMLDEEDLAQYRKLLPH